jgi:disulfide bond formation protein DsbB
VAGLLTAAYHNLLYYGFIPETITPCAQGISCTERQLEVFGFSIPLMSLTTFVALCACLIIARPEAQGN